MTDLELKLLTTTNILLRADSGGNEDPQYKGSAQAAQDEAKFAANINEATGTLEQLFRAINTPMELANIEKTLSETEYIAWQLFRSVSLRLFRKAKRYQIALTNFEAGKVTTEVIQ